MTYNSILIFSESYLIDFATNSHPTRQVPNFKAAGPASDEKIATNRLRIRNLRTLKYREPCRHLYFVDFFDMKNAKNHVPATNLRHPCRAGMGAKHSPLASAPSRPEGGIRGGCRQNVAGTWFFVFFMSKKSRSRTCQHGSRYFKVRRFRICNRFFVISSSDAGRERLKFRVWDRVSKFVVKSIRLYSGNSRIEFYVKKYVNKDVQMSFSFFFAKLKIVIRRGFSRSPLGC